MNMIRFAHTYRICGKHMGITEKFFFGSLSCVVSHLSAKALQQFLENNEKRKLSYAQPAHTYDITSLFHFPDRFFSRIFFMILFLIWYAQYCANIKKRHIHRRVDSDAKQFFKLILLGYVALVIEEI